MNKKIIYSPASAPCLICGETGGYSYGRQVGLTFSTKVAFCLDCARRFWAMLTNDLGREANTYGETGNYLTNENGEAHFIGGVDENDKGALGAAKETEDIVWALKKIYSAAPKRELFWDEEGCEGKKVVEEIDFSKLRKGLNQDEEPERIEVN